MLPFSFATSTQPAFFTSSVSLASGAATRMTRTSGPFEVEKSASRRMRRPSARRCTVAVPFVSWAPLRNLPVAMIAPAGSPAVLRWAAASGNDSLTFELMTSSSGRKRYQPIPAARQATTTMAYFFDMGVLRENQVVGRPATRARGARPAASTPWMRRLPGGYVGAAEDAALRVLVMELGAADG